MYNTIYRDRLFSDHFEELQTVSIGVKLIIKNTPLTYVYPNTIKTYLTTIICTDKINCISNHFWYHFWQSFLQHVYVVDLCETQPASKLNMNSQNIMLY